MTDGTRDPLVARPLTRFGHLSPITGAAFALCFFSGMAANTMLAEGYDQGRLSRRELILANLFNSLPANFLHLPTTFFIAFGVLEDSGYLPRLTVIANRLFSLIGLNGRAVLPMVLGLGCVTMATLTTRILHSPRERLITIFLLALAIPCSAQLGVVLGMLGGVSFSAVLIWAFAMVGVLMLAGFLAAKLIPGRRIPLVTELPPIRLPILGNVVKKTGGRLKWYLIEVIPLFLLGTFIMYSLDKSGALPWIIETGEPLVSGWLGLPKEASAAFVMGFLRRDFGATGLFAQTRQGAKAGYGG